jgi:hypothetical protein
MMRAGRRFVGLAPGDRRLLLEALRWLATARLALWVMPFRRVQQRFDAHEPSSVDATWDASAPAAVARAIRRARRLVPAATCLPQALAGRAMLAKRGIACDLRIGVAKDEHGHLQAHAWVEVEGRVVVGDLPDLARFSPVRSLPGSAP